MRRTKSLFEGFVEPRNAQMAVGNQFSESVAAKLRHYVYRLIDPRNGVTFYVGRGQGNRVFSHAMGKQISNNGEVLKLRTIWAITNSGFEVAHVIHRHGLSEESAKEVEAALIDAYPGLTNIVGGYDGGRGVMHATEIIALYEAPVAEPHHKLILINVNRSSENQDLLDAVRYAWKIDPRKARKADYVLAVRKGMIIGAFKASEWLKATTDNFPGLTRDGYGPLEGRYGFRGEAAPVQIQKLYEQKRVPESLQKKGAANPVRYWNM
jgi:uncharacterized protein